MDFKDVITPLVTLAAVWLAANFTLRNELRKKELEISAAHLEKLSENCDSTLRQWVHYAGCIACTLDAHMLITPGNEPFRINVLNDLLTQIDDSSHGLDLEKIQWCRHGLEFHRENEWKRWKDVVPPLKDRIYDFFMITTPGNENLVMLDKNRTRAEIAEFTADLRVRIKDLDVQRKEIVSAMANDFRLLTQPAPSNIYDLVFKCRKRLLDFFKR
ncbi:hypothetical protein [Yersinia kristensenii]|uniref:hypothetical protein n=1 Tax=Yersinia kristensenii TaxID=28152 RepID=UPI0001A550D6|nr:hypothetical protein [Yersinia kristensenii]EEP91800.1 hypothetical protein ykris0001_9240 [Yersinia kristensenii ATCC 33638]PEH53430.1 hypothetical protein CRM81_08835 [Yersinia kristensenii]SUP67190.1 Uncharacterised protein [Yersinia kristensenii]